jgi:hypothetical protein
VIDFNPTFFSIDQFHHAFSRIGFPITGGGAARLASGFVESNGAGGVVDDTFCLHETEKETRQAREMSDAYFWMCIVLVVVLTNPNCFDVNKLSDTKLTQLTSIP